MKRLKKFSKVFLLCSLLCFSFVSRTYAAINDFEVLFNVNIYNLEGQFAVSQQNHDHTYIYGGIPVFTSFQINNLYFSKQCNYSYTYRVDYQIWGYHNTNVDFRDYAQLIQVNHVDIDTIGTVIQVVDDYHLNLSTFFTWVPTYCPVDSIENLTFNVHDYIRTPIQDNFFYNSQYSTGGTNYYIYDKLFSDIDKQVATQLVTNYYGGGSDYKQDLENIKGQLVNANDKLDETNEKLEDIYSNITNNDTSGAQNTANGFFDNFTDNDYGLSSIITIPLSSIQKITNATCTPINLPIPFTNSSIPLPCMYDLYEDNVPILLNIWQVVSFGLISYAIIVDIFSMVKKFKDPNDDKLEVMSL